MIAVERAHAFPERRAATLAWRDRALPDVAACARLAADGLAEVRLAQDVDLREAAALDALRFVRDCVAVGVTVCWSVAHPGAVDARWLTHLSPPDAFPGYDDVLAAWRDFAFGVLFWRRGPSFAIVRDVRPAWEPALYTLEEDGTLECFERLAVPATLAAIPANEAEGYANLHEARLVLEIAGVALALPYRIHKWPIPFMSV